mmetsp:Transcript_9224/g.12565  ORF Transcript_9224/g.12565 Transcript_9224/m.12565 type:complete len:107 (+) Transcript_9224:20-340(+)
MCSLPPTSSPEATSKPPRSSSLTPVLLDPLPQNLLTGALKHVQLLPIFPELESGHAVDTAGSCRLLVRVDVNLDELAVGKLLGHSREHGGDILARAAPGSCEIDND